MSIYPAYSELEGRRVMVTGASSGIGLATAEAFLEQGAIVVGQYLTHPLPVQELKARFPDRVIPVKADLGMEKGCVSLFQEAGNVSIVIHSAGIWNDGGIATLSRATLEEIFRVNTFSSYYLAREFAKIRKSGSLIFIGSTAGQRGEPGHSHYAGSKAALWGLMASLGQELAPGIRVNMVCPGWVRTPMSLLDLTPEKEESIVQGVPLHRIAEANDIAASCLYLASNGARHITGQEINASGGALLPVPRG